LSQIRRRRVSERRKQRIADDAPDRARGEPRGSRDEILPILGRAGAIARRVVCAVEFVIAIGRWPRPLAALFLPSVAFPKL